MAANRPMLVERFASSLKSRHTPVALAELPIPSSLQILVLAPHPDDFDAVSVTLKHFHENGNEILLAVLTGASSGVLDSFVTPPTRKKKEDTRESEQKRSLEFFGLALAHVRFLRLPEDGDGELILNDNCHAIVEPIFQEFCPDVVICPYGEDTNLSHRNTFALSREQASRCQRPLLMLYNQDPKTIRIRIDAFVPFNRKKALWKGEMLRFHKSQHSRCLQTRGVGVADRVLNVNKNIAAELQCGFAFAEGFQVELFG